MASAKDLKFLLPWFGVMYYMFPAVSYLVTRDWKKVFYDCFGPQILVADTFITIITLWYHIFGPWKAKKTMISVIRHAFGLGLNVMSMRMFAMYHSLSGGMERAKYWYFIVLGKFSLVTLLTFMWVQMGINMDGENDSRAYVGYVMAAAAEVYQIFWPAIVRVWKKNYVSDEKAIFMLKIFATVISIGVSSFEFWEMLNEDFWSSHIERRYMVLSLINIIGGSMQLVVRFIGPERFADPIEKFRSRCQEWKAEMIARRRNLFHGGNV